MRLSVTSLRRVVKGRLQVEFVRQELTTPTDSVVSSAPN